MITIQSRYADLIQGVFASAHARTFPSGTAFRKKFIRGRNYWYARLPDGREKYVGKDIPAISGLIEKEGRVLVMDKESRLLVKFLRANGFPWPGKALSKTIRALSDAGFFRLRGVLVGALAYQTYFPLFGLTPVQIGVEIPGVPSGNATAHTLDVDFAMFPAISVAVGDSMDKSFAKAISEAYPFEQRFDSLGRPIPRWVDQKTGLSVDLLSPLLSADDDEPMRLPSICASSTKLRFLDFLIYDEIQAAILDGAGIAVNVPRPERFAVHKLIISQERRHPVKWTKDMMQAITLSHHLLGNDRGALLDAFSEAWERGPGWRKRLQRALAVPFLPQKIREEFEAVSGKTEGQAHV